MVNLIWSCMAIMGIVYAMINGRMDQVNKALFESASDAVTLSIGLISILVFWLGIMKIAEKAGILTALAKLFRPFIVKLFPDIPSDHRSEERRVGKERRYARINGHVKGRWKT